MKNKKILIIFFIIIIITSSIHFIFKKNKNNYTVLETDIDNSNSIISTPSKLSIANNSAENNLSHILKIENTDNQMILEPSFDYIVYDSNNTILSTSTNTFPSKVSKKSKQKIRKLINYNIIQTYDYELLKPESNFIEFNLYSTINSTYSISYPINIVIFDLNYQTENTSISHNNIAFKFIIKKLSTLIVLYFFILYQFINPFLFYNHL